LALRQAQGERITFPATLCRIPNESFLPDNAACKKIGRASKILTSNFVGAGLCACPRGQPHRVAPTEEIAINRFDALQNILSL